MSSSSPHGTPWPTEERARYRAEILADVGAALTDCFAASEWGRARVSVTQDKSGKLLVSAVDLDELFGDEALVERALTSPEARAWSPALAEAARVLAMLDGCALEDVEGVTFLHEPGGPWTALPGLIRAPSRWLQEHRAELAQRIVATREPMKARGLTEGPHLKLDLASSRVSYTDRLAGAEASQPVTLLGMFQQASRSWGWAWANPSVPASKQRDALDACDRVLERSLWELTTPQFQTDLPTAWLLAAAVATANESEGVLALPVEGGLLFLLVHPAKSTTDAPAR